MKRLFFCIALTLVCSTFYAQKKEISQAKTYIKSGKNLDKAEQLMMKLLTDSANQQNLKIHATLTEALRAQYEQSNEKMYLRQKVDTASVFELALRMFQAHETLDTLDAQPDEKGRVKIKYRSKNAAYLNKYRRNLFNGGAWFIRKQNFERGYTFMRNYLSCGRQPLFSSYNYQPDSVAAYWALFCGYKLNCPSKTLRHADLAKRDSTHLENTLQYLSETYLQLNDTAKYVSTLHEGFLRYKLSPYFFTHLIDFYGGVHRYNSALDIADQALEVCPHNELFLLAKSNTLLNMGHYGDCISVCDSIIARNDSAADAYYNAGAAWMNKAFELEKTAMKENRRVKQQQEFYRKAQPYMEKYRALRPENKDKWASALYNIYLNLNLGRQFEEIDALLRK
ncbi:MAG: hypothetical protein K5893_06150 [Prevotella sp.]|nr:hypothetical protein [Prevotella sp.]